MQDDRELQELDRPNGPVAAALLAGGIGAAVTGLMTALAEASTAIRASLNWYNPAGPLSGKTGVGVIAFFVAWLLLHMAMRGKNVNFSRATTVAFILLAIGLILTFPPVFELFLPPAR
jgi:hypothetical protein